MIYYRCIVAFALWMTSSIGVINAKEDIDLRRGGAKGLLMRGQEERRIHEGQRELQDPSKSKNAPPYVGCYSTTGERKKKRVNGLLSCNSVCSDYDYFALRWSKLKCYCIDGDVGKNTDDSLKSTECWNYANKDTSAPFAVYEVLNPSPTSSAKKTREILSRFYDATNGDEWRNNDGWKDADTSVCKWYGVRCNSDDEVTALNLAYNKLSGTIPAELGNMENLEFLQLDFNDLTGKIPSELGNMESLEWLDLTFNELTGTIPSELGNLQSLDDLWLYNNELTGKIPSELGNLKSLESLYLRKNNLSGTIPSKLGDLKSLKYLYLDDNELTGTIPPKLGNLKSLEELDLGKNNLSGTIPSKLGDLKSLVYLMLQDNDLSGFVPGDVCSMNNILYKFSVDCERCPDNVPVSIDNYCHDCKINNCT